MPSSGPTGKLHPYLSALYVSSDGGSTYTQITECLLITPPDLEKDEAMVTVLDSPGFSEECIASWRKLGEIPIELRYTQAQFNTLWGYFFNNTIYYWKIQLPLLGVQVTNPTIILQGFLKKLKLSEAKAEENEAFSIPASIRIATYTGFAFNLGS